MLYHCNLITSKRKTLSISVESDGAVTIRAPRGLSKRRIDKFLNEKKKWIIKKVKQAKERQEKAQELANQFKDINVKKYREHARIHLTNRLDYFAQKHDLFYNKLRINGAKTRWGSCSPTNNLNFNWKIMLAPPQVIDYLVAHELAHTVQKNHRKPFWDLVAKIDPNFKENRKWLKHSSYLLNANFMV